MKLLEMLFGEFRVQLIDDQQGKIRLVSKDIKKLKTDKQTVVFIEFYHKNPLWGYSHSSHSQAGDSCLSSNLSNFTHIW
jgi:hypothetical protein